MNYKYLIEKISKDTNLWKFNVRKKKEYKLINNKDILKTHI